MATRLLANLSNTDDNLARTSTCAPTSSIWTLGWATLLSLPGHAATIIGASLTAIDSHPEQANRDLRRTGSQRHRPAERSLLAEWRDNWVVLALTLPGVLYFLIFYYVPLFGYVIAFQDYLPFLGFVDSPWVGFDNFRQMFVDSTFWAAVSNTVIIALLQLILYFPAPICLALIIDSLTSTRIRRFVQSVIYLPHFISWVIIVSLFQQFLGGTSVTAQLFRAFGQEAPNIMANAALFKWLMVAELIWKETGWGTIIYLAALLSIDITLYEAAAVDGAGGWRRLWHVTLPGLVGVTILLLILRLGQVLSVGFEQILLQRDFVGPEAGEVLDTYVYFHGVVGGQWSVTAAAGLIKGVVGAGMVLAADRLARRFGQSGLFA
jgi:putative aldouronate transport system permease protein